jgi:hypothetical protein
MALFELFEREAEISRIRSRFKKLASFLDVLDTPQPAAGRLIGFVSSGLAPEIPPDIRTIETASG